MSAGDQRLTRNPPWTSRGSQSAAPVVPPPLHSTSAPMNAPAFYDDENPPANPDAVDYQQWIQANTQQPHSFDYSSMRSTGDPYSYRPQPSHVPPLQPQAQYTFEQYQPPAAQFDYQQHTAQLIPTTEPYFYPRAAQQAVQQTSAPDPGYRYTQPSYHPPPQFNLGTSSSAPPAAPAPSTSELFAYPNFQPPSLPDIPVKKAHVPGPTPPPPTTSASSNSAPPKPTPARAGNKGKKRQRPTEHSSSETDDDSQGDFNVITHPRGRDHLNQSRLPGACTHCKKLKMKCDFPKNHNVCKRCKAGGHHCTVEGRKARSAPNKREYLLAQIRQKDAIIESLLKQLHNPYLATPLSIASYRMATSPSDENDQNVIAWLDRLTSSYKTSVQAAGGTTGSKAFKFESRKQAAKNSDSDSDGEHDTTVRGRSKRKSTGQRASAGLSGAVDSKDSSSEEVDKASGLPDAAVPLGLIAKLSLSNRGGVPKHRGKSDDDDNVGVANSKYFKPGPATDLGIRATMIEQHTPPEILVHGLVTPADVDKLFSIFYEKLNPHVTLLDPVLHTPSTTFTRCPFLFTVVCAVASRYYTEKSEIYPIAMHFAKHAAANALIDGWKSVELCQAYILLYTYGVPAKRWEEDRSWLYIGLAIRIATDLNLYIVPPPSKKPMSEKQEREALNRTRVWLICFNLDRSTATQFGKRATIKDDYVTRNSADWYKRSQYNHPFDIGQCAYTNLLRIVAMFHDELFSDVNSPTGLNKSVDFRAITKMHDDNLTRFHEEWTQRFKDGNTGDPAVIFRSTLLPYLVNYNRLVMYSFGFQRAFESGIQPNDRFFFTKCFEAAKTVVRLMIESLAPSGYMRYSPDGHFVFASFASAFLLKLLRPEFSGLLKPEDETRIFDLIGRLIQTLSSPEIAIDDRHAPKIHARFLAGLLTKHQRDVATSGHINPQNPPSSQTISHGPYGPLHPSGSSSQVFSVAPPQNTSGSSSSLGQDSERKSTRDVGSSGILQSSFSSTSTSAPSLASSANQRTEEPTYHHAGTYSGSNGLLEGQDALMSYGLSTVPEEMLATLQPIKNPSWWNNMMMPGFTWPANEPAMQAGFTGYDYSQHHGPMTNGFEMYQTAQVPMS